MRKYKVWTRLVAVSLSIVLLLVCNVTLAFASERKSDPEMLNEKFSMLLDSIHTQSDLLDKTGLELDETYIGTPIQTYVMENGEIQKTNVKIYPFVYNETVIASTTVSFEKDSAVSAITADTELAEPLDFAYQSQEAFMLLYDESGALYFVDADGSLLLQHGYVTNEDTEQDLADYQATDEDIAVRFCKLTVTEEKLMSSVTQNLPSSASLSVPCINQNGTGGGSQLCWAASVASIGQYLTNVSYTPQQVCYLYTSSSYWCGTASYNIGMGIGNIPTVLDYLYALDYINSLDAPEFTKLATQINGQKPVYATFEPNASSSHAVVMCGYGEYSGLSDSSGTFQVMDPNGGTYRWGEISASCWKIVLYGTTYYYSGGRYAS